MSQPSVYIAKNVKIAVEAIGQCLQANGFTIIGTTPSAQVAIQEIPKLKPTIALIGCELDEGNNLEVIAALQDRLPDTHFVLYTMNGDVLEVIEAFRLGVSGYIHTTTDLDELVRCLGYVLQEKKYLCVHLRQRINSEKEARLEVLALLSEREREILKMVALGKSNKEIAMALFLSTDTINNHRRNIRSKLQFEGGKNILVHYAQDVENYERLRYIREIITSLA
jgi:two-component system, NarL family, nitrate/nitrite response regulator NarL